MTIYFNSKSAEYRWMSNMHLCRLVDKGGYDFRCVEIYYMWRKVAERYRDQIIRCQSGFEAKRLARTCDYDQGFFEKRLEIMGQAVAAKFKQNPDLRDKLIETGDIELVEFAPWGDRFWGVDKTYTGNNHMGKILMDIRKEIANG